jgi:hypothetical protein
LFLIHLIYLQSLFSFSFGNRIGHGTVTIHFHPSTLHNHNPQCAWKCGISIRSRRPIKRNPKPKHTNANKTHSKQKVNVEVNVNTTGRKKKKRIRNQKEKKIAKIATRNQ